MRISDLTEKLTSYERTAHRYIKALDIGDIDGVTAVLEEAQHDSELDRIITEINLALHEELQLDELAADAGLVKELAAKHFQSVAATEPEHTPLTVGEVAARLKELRRVPFSDLKVNDELLTNKSHMPTLLSTAEVKKLAETLGVKASSFYWKKFRDAAIALRMRHGQNQARLAAREETTRNSAAFGRSKQAHKLSKDVQAGDKKED